MERKTKFSHQHGDHVRNVTLYKFYRERFKNWKYPFIALGVFAMFLVSFEATGELGRTDLLNSFQPKENFTFTQENFEVAKKGMLFILDEEMKQCEKFKLQDCVSQAKNFIALVGAASTPEEAESVYLSLEKTISEWDDLQGKAECEQKHAEAVINLENAVRLLEDSDPEKASGLKNELEELKADSSCS